ncbi:MAG: cell division protein FtsA [Parcubacteria group bacterium RIFCSPHIGHO2_01_FULL_47_10b]|nr:MAG: cell division protein FtsA [Parcubacteria group bacterium RIFCSPHIGHO2_01_FULL_47_10b]
MVIAHKAPDELPQILGVGNFPSAGMRKGVVVDIEDVAISLREAAREAWAISGHEIRSCFIGVNGPQLKCQESRGVVAVSRADREIAEADVDRSLKAAEAVSVSPNREILSVLARGFTIDHEEGIKNPVGMNGVRLEVDTLVLTASSPYLKNLTKAVERADLHVADLIPGPLAAAEAVLQKRQKELGVVLLDIGAETTSIAIYEEGEVATLVVLPIGSGHITNDLAIGLRTDIDTAEKVKIRYGSCLPGDIRKTEIINLADLGLEEAVKVRRSEVSEIIEARMKEIFDLVNAEIQKVNKKSFLPAGAVIVGGGAKIPGIVDLAKEQLALPVQVGYPNNVKGLIDQVTDPACAKAVGLLLWGLEHGAQHTQHAIFQKDKKMLGRATGEVRKFFKNLLP